MTPRENAKEFGLLVCMYGALLIAGSALIVLVGLVVDGLLN